MTNKWLNQEKQIIFDSNGNITNVEELFEGIEAVDMCGKESKYINVYLDEKNKFIMGNKAYWGPVKLYHTRTHTMSAIVSQLQFTATPNSFKAEVGRRQYINLEYTYEHI